MTKEELKTSVKKLTEAGSCNPNLKAAADKWLASPDDNAAADALITSLEDSVTTIDELIELTGSEMGVKIFGEDGAKNMNTSAKEAKEGGAKYCICPACQIGGKILENKAAFKA
jgi:hypothetical protein